MSEVWGISGDGQQLVYEISGDEDTVDIFVLALPKIVGKLGYVRVGPSKTGQPFYDDFVQQSYGVLYPEGIRWSYGFKPTGDKLQVWVEWLVEGVFWSAVGSTLFPLSSITGPPGPPGDDGAPGAPGDDGAPGADGALAVSYVQKTSSTVINNDTTLNNDPHLILPVVANSTYAFDLLLVVQSVNGNTGFKCDFLLPSGASGNMSLVASTNATNSFASIAAGVAIAYVGSENVLHVRGGFAVVATAGNAQFRWSQNLGIEFNTTVAAGSDFKLMRIA